MFAVATAEPATLAYFTVDGEAAGGILPISVHTTALKGEDGGRSIEIAVRGLAYDPSNDAFFAVAGDGAPVGQPAAPSSNSTPHVVCSSAGRGAERSLTAASTDARTRLRVYTKSMLLELHFLAVLGCAHPR